MHEIICNAKYEFMKSLLPCQYVATLPNRAYIYIPVPLTGLHCRSFTAIYL